MIFSRKTVLSLSSLALFNAHTQVNASSAGMSSIQKGPPPPPPPPPMKNDFEARGATSTSAVRDVVEDASTKRPHLPPPPPPPSKERFDAPWEKEDNTQQNNQSDKVALNKWDVGSEGDSSDRYQEQITTREQVEKFAQGFRSLENGGSRNQDETRFEVGKERFDTIAKAEEAMNVKEKQQRGVNIEMDQSAEGHGIEKEGIEEQEWIVPKQMQFQPQQPQPLKLHQPGPPPQEPNQMQKRTGQLPRTYPQRPLPPHAPPPQQLSPRNYDYHRRGPISSQQYHQGYPQQRQQYEAMKHHQQQPNPYQNQQFQQALVPRRPQGHPPPGHSLLQRFGRTLDSLADVDTKISQRTQQIAKTVSSSSGSIAGGLSDVMRRGAFEVADGVTGMKESLKDTVNGRLRSVFGGAPTSASEARDEWEDDRRRTVTERRRKAILGDRAGRGRHDGPGETYTGLGDSPLQQHLSNLASGPRSGTSASMGEQVGITPEGERQSKSQPQQEQGGAMDAIFGGTPSTQQPDVVSKNVIGSGSGSAPQDTGSTGKPGQDVQHPFVKQTYPPNMTTQPEEAFSDEEDTDDEEPIHSTPGVDSVDPSTFFVSSPSVQYQQRDSSTKPISSFSFEEERSSLSDKISGVFGSMASAVRIPSFRRRGSNTIFDDSGWSDDEGWGTESPAYSSSKQKVESRVNKKPATLNGSVANGMKRNEKGEVNDLLQRRSTSSPLIKKSTANLLLSKEMHQFARVGRSKAVMDVMAMAFLYACIQETLSAFNPSSISLESLQFPLSLNDLNPLLKAFVQAFDWKGLADSWAPFALIAAFLSVCTRNLLCEPKKLELASIASKKVQSNLLLSQLYLRLASGKPLQHSLSDTFSKAEQGQGSATVEISRLRSFVLITLTITLTATTAIIKPICASIFTHLTDFFSYEGLREWPMDWRELGKLSKDLTLALGNNLYNLLEEEYRIISSNPIAVVVTASFIGVLFFISQLPFIERTRSATALNDSGIMSDGQRKEDLESKSTNQVSNMGTSSATRLGLHMQDGAIERILSRWQLKIMDTPKKWTISPSTSKPLQKLVYISLCCLLASILIFVQVVVSATMGTPIDWARFSGIVLALLYATRIAVGSLFASLQSSDNNAVIASFLSVLANTSGELESSKTKPRFPTASSPGKGLEVSDLWAAHVSKR